MSMPESVGGSVEDALARAPDLVWVSPQRAIFGWGTRHRFDPGTGSERFERATEFARELGETPALAAFTFDEESPGSQVIAPEAFIRIEAGTTTRSGVVPPLASLHVTMPPLVDTIEDPGRWIADVAKAMRTIASGEVEKVVLSRPVELVFADELPIPAVVERLVRSQTGSHTFRLEDFVGSSPELLVALDGESVRSLSLAGSTASDGTERARLTTSKMRLEHELAADSVEENLASHCVTLHRAPTEVTTFADIAHLATEFVGVVRPGRTVLDLVAGLHPTAAVAGVPTKSALELIREIEGRNRGLYTGPVGWLDGRGNGEFAIALRCGEARGSRLRLQVGAGLVAGSDPYAELEETRLKLLPMTLAVTG